MRIWFCVSVPVLSVHEPLSGPQGFDRGRPAREHAVLRQSPRTHGHEDREDQQELLREHRHRHRDAGQRCAQPVALGDAEEEPHGYADDQTEHGEPAHELSRLPMQRRRFGLDASEHGPDTPDLAACAGRGDFRQSPPRDHHRSCEDVVRCHRGCPVCGSRCGLGDGQGFATEQRLVHRQVIGRQQPRVGGTRSPSASSMRSPRTSSRPAMRSGTPSARPGARAGHVAQGFEHALRPALLYQGDGHDDAEKGQQDAGLRAVSEDEVDRNGRRQQLEHGLACDLQQNVPARAAWWSGQFVGPSSASWRAACSALSPEGEARPALFIH